MKQDKKKMADFMRAVILFSMGLLSVGIVINICNHDWVNAVCNVIWVFMGGNLVSLMKRGDEMRGLLDSYDALTDKMAEVIHNQKQELETLKGKETDQ